MPAILTLGGSPLKVRYDGKEHEILPGLTDAEQTIATFASRQYPELVTIVRPPKGEKPQPPEPKIGIGIWPSESAAPMIEVAPAPVAIEASPEVAAIIADIAVAEAAPEPIAVEPPKPKKPRQIRRKKTQE